MATWQRSALRRERLMEANDGKAFGAPGHAPSWCSSDKDRVITALGPSRLWATIGHGILNEVYWPSTGQPQVRDLGFIVAGDGFWCEVKREANYELSTPAPRIPLPQVVHKGKRYRLLLEFLPDPNRDVLLIRAQLDGEGLHLYPLLAPHLGMSGWDNTAWVADGLYAQRDNQVLCLATAPGFARASAGYVGSSDGWQDFSRNGSMAWTFARAEQGNVALMGELDAGENVLALAFAQTAEGARTQAMASLAEGYAQVREHFVAGWEAWGRQLSLPEASPEISEEACLSATVLRMHEDRTYLGAIVASLSIPWGTQGDDPGGYHLVWTRDAVEAGFGLLAAGQVEDVRHLLAYLTATQQQDGGWAQNFYPDGRPRWTGIQLDEVGFPILLAAKLHEVGCAHDLIERAMVRKAAAYLAQQGPVSPQGRWEENPGVGPFTLAVEVAALVAASQYYLEGDDRDYALSLADCWNERIEDWTYVRDTELSRRHSVDGYYIRISPPPDDSGSRGRVQVRNRVDLSVAAESLVGLDFIYLARLGLRSASDQRMLDSLKVVDATLRVETPSGPGYHRYYGDGYGEHENGRPFDGTGIGRLWPLLTGERGQMALLQGEDPMPYLETMARMAGRCGLLPEQVWDVQAIPELNLFPGKPTGSAMPLVWAHAEFLKLLVARERGRPLELLDAVRGRYGDSQRAAAKWHWRDTAPVTTLPAGRSLVIESRRPFSLHYGFEGWQRVQDQPSQPLGLGMHGVVLETDSLNSASELNFTRYLVDEGRWEGTDHRVTLTSGHPKQRRQPPGHRRTRRPAKVS
jgi:glucoamylase